MNLYFRSHDIRSILYLVLLYGDIAFKWSEIALACKMHRVLNKYTCTYMYDVQRIVTTY